MTDPARPGFRIEDLGDGAPSVSVPVSVAGSRFFTWRSPSKSKSDTETETETGMGKDEKGRAPNRNASPLAALSRLTIALH